MGYKRIMVPVDGSETSARGLAEALRLAKDSGAKLVLTHVIDDYAVLSAPELGAQIEPLLKAMRQSGEQLLGKLSAEARSAGVTVECQLLDSLGTRVADLIVDEAVRQGAELIVMGTHGRRGIKRALIGSDAELVVRLSPVPVMLVPPAGRVVPGR